jgi:DNA-directed RNA polymerase subunit RPC12/RpoP
MCEHDDEGFFSITRIHREDIKSKMAEMMDIEGDEFPLELSNLIDNIPDAEMQYLASRIVDVIMDDFWGVIEDWIDTHDELKEAITIHDDMMAEMIEDEANRSVECIKCDRTLDERDGYTPNDGEGIICPDCAKKIYEDDEK